MVFPNGSIPLSEWSGAGATRELIAIVSEIDQRNRESERRNARLAHRMMLLTVAQTVGGIASLLAAAFAIAAAW